MSYGDTKLTKKFVKEAIESTKQFGDSAVREKYAVGSEQTLDDVKLRVLDTLLENLPKELSSPELKDDIFDMFMSGKFLPAGSLLSGVGVTDKKSSYSNCYITLLEQDSIESIGTCITEMMRTYSYRGGCGVDISVLRPDRAVCHNASKESSGAVSFMPLLSMATRTIGQNGRRGALMLSIKDRHPDMMSFIWAKADTKSVIYTDTMDPDVPNINRANISVQITDEFMKAVQNKEPWVCKFPDMSDMDFYNKNWTGDYEVWEKLGGTFKEYRSHFTGVHDKNHTRFAGRSVILEVSDPLVRKLYEVEEPKYTTWSDEYDRPLGDTIWMSDEWFESKSKDEYPHVAITLTEKHTSLLIPDPSSGKTVNTMRFVIPTADKILEEIAMATSIRADPGIQYIDNAHNNTWMEVISPEMKIITTNPCGEIYCSKLANNCLLMAHQISKYVKDPYTPQATFDMNAWERACELAVIIGDTFSTMNQPLHALEYQREGDRQTRRLGIEFCGLADAISMLGVKYDGSPECLDWIERILSKKAQVELATSAKLAEVLGAAPVIAAMKDKSKITKHPFIKRVIGDNKELIEKINTTGLRNSSIATAGPTGTLSLIMDNCSSGIEPVFSLLQLRTTRISDGGTFSIVNNTVFRELLKQMEVGIIDEGITIDEVKEKFNIVESHELDYLKRIEIQAMVQKYTDNSISTTINMPSGTTLDDITYVYVKAHELGCKGMTMYIDGTLPGVINVDNGDKSSSSSGQRTLNLNADGCIDIKSVPIDAQGTTHTVRWNGINIYITVPIGEDGKPVSIFSTTPKTLGNDANGDFDAELYYSRVQLWELATRLASISMRSYVNIEEVIKQLDATVTNVSDPIAHIVRVLRKYVPEDVTDTADENNDPHSICPACGQKTYVRQSGCGQCYNPDCMYSKCS